MKCPDCGNEMIEVYSWIEHPGPEGRMIGHPGPFKYYECKKCGTKVEREQKEEGEGQNLKDLLDLR